MPRGMPVSSAAVPGWGFAPALKGLKLGRAIRLWMSARCKPRTGANRWHANFN